MHAYIPVRAIVSIYDFSFVSEETNAHIKIEELIITVHYYCDVLGDSARLFIAKNVFIIKLTCILIHKFSDNCQQFPLTVAPPGPGPSSEGRDSTFPA